MKSFDEFEFSVGLNTEYLPQEYTGEIYHYTSAVGFDSILFKDPCDTVLWASRYDCLNDATEGKVAEEVLQEVSLALRKRNEISEELYQLFSSVKTARTILLHHEVDGELIFSDVECNRFICSFSKNSDSLSMWNYYTKGDKYEGFNVGFYSNDIKEALRCYFNGAEAVFHIYPVIYDPNEQRQLIEEFLLELKVYHNKENEPRISTIISERLVDWGLIFKKDCFKHEEEVRIVVDVAKRETSIPRQYRFHAGYTIPYIELKVEKAILSFVCYGPLHKNSEQKNSQTEIMEEMLALKGYHNAYVTCSKIPIRY